MVCSVICGILGCVSCWLIVCVWVGGGGLFILSLLYMWAISSLWIVSSLSEGGRSSHASSHVIACLCFLSFIFVVIVHCFHYFIVIFILVYCVVVLLALLVLYGGCLFLVCLPY